MFLRGAGFDIRDRVGVLCHHPEVGKTFLTLTPDIVMPDLRLVVEVDPCGDSDHSHACSHAGKEDTDRLRNDLLAVVGWTVIRLRLGATVGQHIGDRDVVVESSGFTKAAQAALLEAIGDFTSLRPPTVRVVAKGKSPARAQRRSHVVNIGLDRYTDDTFWFTWYPSLDSPEKVLLRLAANGRYLYNKGYVAEIGLHDVDQSAWKARLTGYLANRTPDDLVGTTKWPWGDLLLITDDPDDGIVRAIIDASDHEKQTIDRVTFYFSTRGHHIGHWTPASLVRADGSPLAFIHPDAVDAGYRFAAVTSRDGYRGPFQEVFITRKDEPEKPSVE